VNNVEESGSVSLCHAESVEDSGRQGSCWDGLVFSSSCPLLERTDSKTQNTQLQHESCNVKTSRHATRHKELMIVFPLSMMMLSG